MPSLKLLLSTATLLPILTVLSISLPPHPVHQISLPIEPQLILKQDQDQDQNPFNHHSQQQQLPPPPTIPDFKCDLPPIQSPPSSSEDGLPDSRDIFFTDAALKKQAERHSAIVKVPSICYDDLGEFEKDERWEVFYELHEALRGTFPLVHKYAKVEKINRFGLIYTLNGSDPSLKPTMFAAHQDVVPVADASTWTYPPFSAHFDGTYLWGRGSSDDKNSLVALMSALETILSTTNSDWKPRRTLIYAFGFDEECSGYRGAGHIAQHLESVYGKDGIAIILDEGGMGTQLVGNDTLYALPAVTEKGHVDIHYKLNINGGHSSTPFPHTGIGVMSEIVVALESNPYSPALIKGSPLYNHMVCQARYSPDADVDITKSIREDDLESLTNILASIDRATNFRIQTSQAVDIIHAGVKINAMPEVVTLGVNYRVAQQNSIEEIQHNSLKYIQPIVKKYGISVHAFENDEKYWRYAREQQQKQSEKEGEEALDLSSSAESILNSLSYQTTYNATLILTTGQPSSPAPISPSTSTSDEIWALFSGVIQHSFSSSFPDGSGKGQVIPVGDTMTGNTDTRHYISLSQHIYRWTPVRGENAHTVDERVDMRNHVKLVAFYWDMIRVFDRN